MIRLVACFAILGTAANSLLSQDQTKEQTAAGFIVYGGAGEFGALPVSEREITVFKKDDVENKGKTHGLPQGTSQFLPKVPLEVVYSNVSPGELPTNKVVGEFAADPPRQAASVESKKKSGELEVAMRKIEMLEDKIELLTEMVTRSRQLNPRAAAVDVHGGTAYKTQSTSDRVRLGAPSGMKAYAERSRLKSEASSVEPKWPRVILDGKEYYMIRTLIRAD